MSVFTGTIIDCDSCGEAQFRHTSTDHRTVSAVARHAGWVLFGKSWSHETWHCPACVQLDKEEADARKAVAR